MSSSDQRDFLKDVFGSFKRIFPKYDRTTRKRGWNALMSGEGKSKVQNLINNPGAPVVGIAKLHFKEWLEQSQF